MARPTRTPASSEAPERTNPGLALEVPPAFLEQLAERVAELLDGRSDRDLETEPWLGVEHAAEFLACPRSRIYALASAGRIPHRKDGSRLLFRRSELDGWLERGGGKRP